MPSNRHEAVFSRCRRAASEIGTLVLLAWRVLRAHTGGAATGGTLCVVVDSGNRVLVVKPTYRRYWSLPGGFLDVGEAPAAGAAREVREETGVVVSDLTLIFQHQRRNHVDYLFAATGTETALSAANRSWEIAATRWVPPDEEIELHPVALAMLRSVPGGLNGIRDDLRIRPTGPGTITVTATDDVPPPQDTVEARGD